MVDLGEARKEIDLSATPDDRVPTMVVLIAALAWFNDGKLDERELGVLLRALEDLSGAQPPDSELLAKRWLVKILAALNQTRIQLLNRRRFTWFANRSPQYMRFEDAAEIVDRLADEIAKGASREFLEKNFGLAERLQAALGSTAVSKALLKRVRRSWKL